MSRRPHQTPKRRRCSWRVDEHRLQPAPDWEADLLARARRQHDAVRDEETDEVW